MAKAEEKKQTFASIQKSVDVRRQSLLKDRPDVVLLRWCTEHTLNITLNLSCLALQAMAVVLRQGD